MGADPGCQKEGGKSNVESLWKCRVSNWDWLSPVRNSFAGKSLPAPAGSVRRPRCQTQQPWDEESSLCSLPALVQRLTKASTGSLTRIRTIRYCYYTGNLAHRSLHTLSFCRV